MQVSKPAKFEQQSLVALPMETYQRFLEEEGQMTVDDNLEIATAEAKNNLEEYLLALRSHLSDRYADFVKPADRDALVSELNALEDWLYEEGEDEKKSVRTHSYSLHVIRDFDHRACTVTPSNNPCCEMQDACEAQALAHAAWPNWRVGGWPTLVPRHFCDTMHILFRILLGAGRK
jgi:hypothetical protein